MAPTPKGGRPQVSQKPSSTVPRHEGHLQFAPLIESSFPTSSCAPGPSHSRPAPQDPRAGERQRCFHTTAFRISPHSDGAGSTGCRPTPAYRLQTHSATATRRTPHSCLGRPGCRHPEFRRDLDRDGTRMIVRCLPPSPQHGPSRALRIRSPHRRSSEPGRNGNGHGAVFSDYRALTVIWVQQPSVMRSPSFNGTRIFGSIAIPLILVPFVDPKSSRARDPSG
jgi:hypothetical protein